MSEEKKRIAWWRRRVEASDLALESCLGPSDAMFFSRPIQMLESGEPMDGHEKEDGVDSREWSVVCSKEVFESLKDNEAFVALVLLGRITNAIRFFHLIFLSVLEDETPSGKRQRLNCFLFLGPALAEGLDYASTLGRLFNDREVFSCFREFLDRSETKAYRRGIVRRIRNKMAFHFDATAMHEALNRIEFEEPRLCTGVGPTVGETYYELSDEAAIHSVLIAEDGEILPWHSLEDLMRDTAVLSSEFGRCADRLIGQVSEELGWVLVETG